MKDSNLNNSVEANTKPVNLEQVIPDVLAAMAGVHEVMGRYEFDRTLYHLVLLRASQINRCSHCVKMHTEEARQDGESSQRLDRVVVWDQVGDFTPREKAALEWTEALTILDQKTNLSGIRARLREYFTEKEIGILTSLAGMINLWNRIGISGQ